MRARGAFIVGAITGAVVVALWGQKIADAVADTIRGVRVKAAAGVQAVEEKADEVLDRGEKSLRRVETALHDTKEHVTDLFRAGRNAMRP